MKPAIHLDVSGMPAFLKTLAAILLFVILPVTALGVALLVWKLVVPHGLSVVEEASHGNG